MTWRMPAMCDNCPFATSGPGLHLQRTLRPGRWREILDGLRREQVFHCHKTSDETGDGSNLVCAGAIEWQNQRGLCSLLQQVMERMEAAQLDRDGKLGLPSGEFKPEENHESARIAVPQTPRARRAPGQPARRSRPRTLRPRER